MSSSESEDDLYTNTASIFGKITQTTTEDIKTPELSQVLNDSIEDVEVLSGKRKSDVLEDELEVLEIAPSPKKKLRGRKKCDPIEVITISQNSPSVSLNDSINVIEQINQCLERNKRGRGRRKSRGTPPTTRSQISPRGTATPRSAATARTPRGAATQRRTPRGRKGRTRGAYTTRALRNAPQVVATIELDVDYPILNSNNFKIDLGEETSVKVLWKSQSCDKFDLRRKEKLDKIFKYYAEKENVSEELLYFSYNDHVVRKTDTPESLKLNVASIIEGGILSTKTHLSSGYKQDHLELKIQWKNLKRPLIYNMKVTDEMSVLMEHCSKEMSVPVERLKFYFDGDLIEPDDTPAGLDLEGGECIDCVEK